MSRIATQDLHAQQTFWALFNVAQRHLTRLEKALDAATDPTDARVLRNEIANTRNAIRMAEILAK